MFFVHLLSHTNHPGYNSIYQPHYDVLFNLSANAVAILPPAAGNAKSTLTLRCDPNSSLGVYLQFQGPGVQYGTTPVNGSSATVPTSTSFTFDTTGNPTSSAITGSFAAGWGGGVVASSGVFYLRTATGNIPITYTGTTSSSFTG